MNPAVTIVVRKDIMLVIAEGKFTLFLLDFIQKAALVYISFFLVITFTNAKQDTSSFEKV